MQSDEHFDPIPWIPGLDGRDRLVRGVAHTEISIAPPGYQRQYTAYAKVPGHPRLEAHVLFVTRAGLRIASQVYLVPLDPGRLPTEGITVAALRAVRLGTIQAELNEILAREENLGRLPSARVDGFRSNPRPGRGGRDPYDYAVWAQRYVEKLGTRHPIRELMQEHPGYSEHAIRARLNRARAKGLLTDSPPGKAGGELTEKAKLILRSGRGTERGSRPVVRKT